MSDLSAVPARQRRLLAIMLAPLGIVLLVAGVLPLVLAASWPARVVGVLVAVVALLVLGVASGLRRSAVLSDQAAAEARLDAEILAASGGGCGGDCDSCGTDDCAVKALPRL